MIPVDDINHDVGIFFREFGYSHLKFQPAVAFQVTDALPGLVFVGNPGRLPAQLLQVAGQDQTLLIKVFPSRGEGE